MGEGDKEGEFFWKKLDKSCSEMAISVLNGEDMLLTSSFSY